MEKIEKFGVSCFRLEGIEAAPRNVYRYDLEPEESAHWLKSLGVWQMVSRDKVALCSIKKGEIVQSEGYLYGSKQALGELVEKTPEVNESPLLQVLLDLFKANVLSKEQAMERMLRHTTSRTAEQLLHSV